MITVLHPGIYSTVQDLGRKGFADIGVPISGAMDAYSVKIGNQLVQNDENEAAIEIAFGGAKFQFNQKTQICITGANFSPMIDGAPIKMHSSLSVDKDSILSFGKRVNGVRSYLCVHGGIQSDVVLKSRSFYEGITVANSLQKRDQLNTVKSWFTSHSINAKLKLPDDQFSSQNIYCSKGPEFDSLSSNQKEELLHTVFSISNDNNRMGYRLNEVLHNDLKPILTSGVLPGTVQLTPSGKMIILMRDCQVTGGYPRILQLTEESICQLAQKTTSDRISFVLI